MGTSGQSITLANSIIGVGILAMPFCFQQCGVVLATLILFLMGLVSRLSCHFLLKSALLSRRRSYEFLAFHVFGPAGKMAVEIGIIGFLMGTCVAYFVVVGDLGPQIISKVFNIDQTDTLRTSVMVVVTFVCVLPLGLLRNVDSLSSVSAATIGFYFCLVIKVVSEATARLRSAEGVPPLELWRPAGVLQCAPIFAMALFCQTQLFEIFESMPSLSLEKMNVVTKNAINICAGVYFTLGLFGYIAFSSQTISGNILVSLSPGASSDAIKLGFVLSLAFSFPLVIFPCRASLYSFLYKKVGSHESHGSGIPDAWFRRLTVLIVGAALAASLASSNVERVLGLLGASAGGLVCLVLPAAAYMRLQPRHATAAKLILILGVVIMVLGTYANLEAAPAAPSPAPDSQDRIDQIVQDFFEGRKGEKEAVAKPLSDGYQTAPIEPKVIKEEPEIIKDSEVQPPNPVPPEPQSEEKQPKPDIQDTLKEIKLKADTKIEANKLNQHPRNVKGKLENLSLSKIEEEKIKEVEDGEDKAKLEEKKSEEKVEEMIKQRELIETIKQHGEEQKELIKEQKEILDEILKTKEELKQNKKDVVDIEAKKLAVESIQKIANIAIQSLAGASGKPIKVEDKKEKPFEKIANEAVQEIAKKAVESIVAINKIEDTVKETKTVIEEKVEPKEEKNVNNNVAEINNDPNAPPKASAIVLNQNIAQDIQDVQKNAQNIPKPEMPKEHSHLPDEPQYYKQGEDEQSQKDHKVDRSIPIAVALNGNTKQAQHNNAGDNKLNKPEANVDQKPNADLLRQKRETNVKPLEDKEICEKDVLKDKMIGKDVNNQLLPNVDLNDLLSRMPVDSAVPVRSLKSVDE